MIYGLDSITDKKAGSQSGADRNKIFREWPVWTGLEMSISEGQLRFSSWRQRSRLCTGQTPEGAAERRQEGRRREQLVAKRSRRARKKNKTKHFPDVYVTHT